MCHSNGIIIWGSHNNLDVRADEYQLIDYIKNIWDKSIDQSMNRNNHTVVLQLTYAMPKLRLLQPRYESSWYTSFSVSGYKISIISIQWTAIFASNWAILMPIVKDKQSKCLLRNVLWSLKIRKIVRIDLGIDIVITNQEYQISSKTKALYQTQRPEQWPKCKQYERFSIWNSDETMIDEKRQLKASHQKTVRLSITAKWLSERFLQSIYFYLKLFTDSFL